MNFQYSVRLLAAWCHPEIMGREDLRARAVQTFGLLYGNKIPATLILDGLWSGEPE